MHKLDRIKSHIEGNEYMTSLYKTIKRFGISYFYEWTLHKKFEDACGYKLNLENPKLFSEKIQWIKVYCHDPLMTKCADKIAVREYVEEKVGQEYLTNIYGVWDRAEEIEHGILPLSFVLKTNHSCAQVILVPDKRKLDWAQLNKVLDEWISENYYYVTGEWVYKNINPKIFCEEFLDDNMTDYKFYCFNGIPKFLYVSCGLGKNIHDEVRMDFMTLDWHKCPFQRREYKEWEELPPRPENLSEMTEIARKLAEPFLFVRVDLYSVNGKTKFSELTFYPNGGFAPFYPLEYEREIGDMLAI